MSLKIVLSFLCLCTTIHCKKSSVLRSLTSSSLESSLKNTRRKLLSAGDKFWDDFYEGLIFKELKDIQPQMNNLITELKQITNKRFNEDEQELMFSDEISEEQSQSEKYIDFRLECMKAGSDFFQTNKVSIMQILKDSANKENSDLFNSLCVIIVIFDSFNALSDIIYKHKQDILQIVTKSSEISDFTEVALFISSLKETFSNDEISKMIDTVSESLANILPIIAEHIQGTLEEEEKDPSDELVNQVFHFKRDNVIILIRNSIEIMVNYDLNIIFDDKEKLKKLLLDDKIGEIYVIFKNELGEEKTKMIIYDMFAELAELAPEECDSFIKDYNLMEKEKKKKEEMEKAKMKKDKEKEENKNDGLSKTILIIIIVGSVIGVISIGIVLYFCCKKK